MLIVRRAELYHTTFGIITPVGVMIPKVVWYNFTIFLIKFNVRNVTRVEKRVSDLDNLCIISYVVSVSESR